MDGYVGTLTVHGWPLASVVANVLRSPLGLLQLRAHTRDVSATIALRRFAMLVLGPIRCARALHRQQVSEIEKVGSTDADGTANEIAKARLGFQYSQ